MDCKKLQFSGHAVQQMFKRGIAETDVNTVIKTGNIIKEYPSDKPYPSCLLLGFVRKKPLHVVLATDKTGNCYIITTYWPTPDNWENDYATKK